MSRLFNGTTDVMRYNVDASVAMNDALTMMAVVRILAADNSWLSILEGNKADDTESRCAMGRATGASNNVYFSNHVALIQAGSITASLNWFILAVTRSAAAATNFHVSPIGGSRTTTAGGALADGNTLASQILSIGGVEDPANIRVAACAIWNGTELSTTQLDGVLSAKTTASIAALSPTWLVDDSDAFATNLVNPGFMNRTSISGTTDDADDPSGWVYGLGGSDYTGTVPAAGAATALGNIPAVSTLTRPYILTTIA